VSSVCQELFVSDPFFRLVITLPRIFAARSGRLLMRGRRQRHDDEDEERKPS